VHCICRLLTQSGHSLKKPVVPKSGTELLLNWRSLQSSLTERRLRPSLAEQCLRPSRIDSFVDWISSGKIIDRGSVQASVTERPVALSPANGGESVHAAAKSFLIRPHCRRLPDGVVPVADCNCFCRVSNRQIATTMKSALMNARCARTGKQ
jgi:hypothetical protein